MPEQRVTCPRPHARHWLFTITAEGIRAKCRGCHELYLFPWAEIDAKRQEVSQPLAQSIPVSYNSDMNRS